MALRGLLKAQSPFSKQLRLMLGIKPKNEFLYELALRHSSMPHTGKFTEDPNNQRLEFLGDAILGSICADVLYREFPKSNEGFLSSMRAKMVNRNTLNAIAVKIGIPDLLMAQKSGFHQAGSIYGDALEAIIGAVYLDRGYKVCYTFVKKKIIDPHIDLEQLNEKVISYKSKLLEWGQKNRKVIDFKFLPSKKKNTYDVILSIDGKQMARASGRSKKSAEEQAAKTVYGSKKLKTNP